MFKLILVQGSIQCVRKGLEAVALCQLISTLEQFFILHVIAFLNTPSSPVRVCRVVVGVHRGGDDRVVEGFLGQWSIR